MVVANGAGGSCSHDQVRRGQSLVDERLGTVQNKPGAFMFSAQRGL